MPERKPSPGEVRRKYVSASNAHNKLEDVLNIVRAHPLRTGLEYVQEGLLQKRDCSYLYLLEQQGEISYRMGDEASEQGWVVTGAS